ncbi:MAG: type I phosphomannose isomerase catalytic subunit [Isosphaeraceae bacterium]
MPDQLLYPLRFKPILRRLIWGGRRLGTVLHKPIGEGSDYAESWELADYHDQVSVVSNGPLAGTTLRELMDSRPTELLGPAIGARDQFPLLVKFIDAREDLSVQVHPDDEKGRRLAGDNGKTEAWLVLAAEPGSVIYAGLRPGVGPEDFRRAIETGAVEPLLHRFPARPGDAILIEAGTVHAIGAGVLLAEVQQMSDATFRVFDWNRVGADGKPRELHIEQAMESIDFGRGPVDPMKTRVEEFGGVGTREQLPASRYFALERWRLHEPIRVEQGDRFAIFVGLEGELELEAVGGKLTLRAGETVLVPAAVPEWRLVPRGEAAVLTCVVP